jgi:hypothetical protein
MRIPAIMRSRRPYRELEAEHARLMLERRRHLETHGRNRLDRRLHELELRIRFFMRGQMDAQIRTSPTTGKGEGGIP